MSANDSTQDFDYLRTWAEKLLRERGPDAGPSLPADVDGLLHELQVHQTELHLQNEELQRLQQELELARDRYFDLYDLAPGAIGRRFSVTASGRWTPRSR